MNIKKLLQKIVENQRVSHITIALSSNTTVSISATWTWATLPFDIVIDRSGLFVNSSITSNCIVIPKSGIYRLSGMYTCENSSYCRIYINDSPAENAGGIQSNTSFMSVPIPVAIKKLNSGDKVSAKVCKAEGANPAVAGGGYTRLLVEKIG